ncbi:MAG: Modification methylase FokI [Firmicutes bacterium]|nr:Modification methylase FokI [Bacillota bacterium]
MNSLDHAPAVREQVSLWADDPSGEDSDFLSRQLVTYIGNKRSLLSNIAVALDRSKKRLGKNKLRILDAFCGSGVVSRFFKAHSSYLAACDIEDYAGVISRCFLSNRSNVRFSDLEDLVSTFNAQVEKCQLPSGFIEDMYAARDESRITADDRVFYTKANAKRIDNYRRLIETAPLEFKNLLLGPLLGRASVHANTAGVFKGFYKNKETQIGQFGGSGKDALVRILGTIELEAPVLSRFECECEVMLGDINDTATRLPEIDLAYLDPPYNQHPYGSNYFMLNLITNYERPNEVSRVSGIPTNWKRSGYNARGQSLKLMEDLVDKIPAKHLLLSFNDEGFIAPNEMHAMLSKRGKVDVMDIHYNTFRGSRSLANRSIHVTEHLFFVERH